MDGVQLRRSSFFTLLSETPHMHPAQCRTTSAVSVFTRKDALEARRCCNYRWQERLMLSCIRASFHSRIHLPVCSFCSLLSFANKLVHGSLQYISSVGHYFYFLHAFLLLSTCEAYSGQSMRVFCCRFSGPSFLSFVFFKASAGGVIRFAVEFKTVVQSTTCSVMPREHRPAGGSALCGGAKRRNECRMRGTVTSVGASSARLPFGER